MKNYHSELDSTSGCSAVVQPVAAYSHPSTAAIRDPSIAHTSSCQYALRDVTTLYPPYLLLHASSQQPGPLPFECDVIYGRPLWKIIDNISEIVQDTGYIVTMGN